MWVLQGLVGGMCPEKKLALMVKESPRVWMHYAMGWLTEGRNLFLSLTNLANPNGCWDYKNFLALLYIQHHTSSAFSQCGAGLEAASLWERRRIPLFLDVASPSRSMQATWSSWVRALEFIIMDCESLFVPVTTWVALIGLKTGNSV